MTKRAPQQANGFFILKCKKIQIINYSYQACREKWKC